EAGKEAGKQAAKKGAKEGAKKAAAASAKKSTAQAAKAGLSALLKNPYVWIAIVVILIIVLLFVLILLLNNNSYSSNTQCGVSDTIPGGAGGTGDLKIEYVKMKVPEKIKVKTKGKYTYYDIDDYVAGVLYAEPGNQNDELLKAFAIAARSLALSKMQSQGFIINSSANQNFATNAKNRKGKYRRIAEETSGIVMVTGKPGKYKYAAAAYDVVCLDPKKGGGVTATEYIMCQAQVHIPKSWMNKQHYSEKRLRSYTYHGLGMSFLGAKYLTLEKKYTASDLLKLFYKNYTVVSIYPNTDYVANSSSVTENKCANNIVDLNIKETPSSATIIHDQSIENFLAQHGSSIKQVNDGLLNTVKSAGIGTRAAVTKGAVYTINTFLNYGARLPYMNGGSLIYAMNPLWGSKLSKPVIKKTDNVVYEYWYEGLDCGRFVRWVFLNAGINLPTVGASSFLSIPGTVKHDASDVTQYVAQPGDVLVRGDGGHVVLVLNYFENGSNKGYYVAEASGGDSGILVKKRLLSNLKSKNYYAIDMSSVYNGNQYKTSNFESVYNSKRKE
ncbi:MAG: hypothetical protein IKN09_01000, partial [Clostridia bacterium]|nr:hypothetical protein [Clostridia bacterium]